MARSSALPTSLCTAHVHTHFVIFSASFDGRVVAKLPFEPFGIVQSVSHRNLMGKDVTDCSFLFLYILCTMSIREVSLEAQTQCLPHVFNASYRMFRSF